jgi:hypothetical protein
MKITPTHRTIIETALYLTSAAVLWKGRKIALRDPLTRGYLALAISHMVSAAMFRDAIKEVENALNKDSLFYIQIKDNLGRIEGNIIGIFSTTIAILTFKSLFPNCAIIKFDNRAVLSTAFGSTVLGTLFYLVEKKSEARTNL